MPAKVSDADLRLLRVYMAVVECGGFAAAQALLNVSESTISTHMHDLEARLGLHLCQRGRSGFRLTDDGEAVYHAAQELFGSLDQFQSQVIARKRQMSGTISIGIPDTIITHPEFLLSKAIEHFYSHDHAVQITIQTLTPRDLERGVLEGRLQFAIAPHHQKIAGLQYAKLFKEVNYFYCGRQHPLFNSINRKLNVDEIGGAGLIGRGYLTRFDRKFFGTSPHKATVFSMEAAAVLILSGKFGGFLPSHYAQRWVETDQMRALRPDLLTFAPDFGVLTRKGRDLGLAAKTLIAELKRVGSRL